MSLDITVTDMFCGAGGSTTGAVKAGAVVSLALNHWKRAIETHNTNYPNVEHRLTDLLTARPNAFPTTTMLVASPECTSHSLAKGRQRKYEGMSGLWEARTPDPREERSRSTMYTALEWAEYHNYHIVILENVVDIQHWRPLPGWLMAWKNLGYDYQWVSLNSMFAHPTPQSRDRAYFVAWKQGNRKPDLKITPLAYCSRCEKDIQAIQCWKQPGKKLGKYRQQYVYCCSEHACEVTPYCNPAASAIDWTCPTKRISERTKPLKAKTMQRIADGLAKFAHEPFLMDHIAEYRPRSLNQPMSTIVGGGNHQSLVIPPAYLLSYYNNGSFEPVSQPVPTVTTLDRCALVTQSGTPEVEDCGFRMLEPHEIQAAMAFPKEYILTGTRRERVKQLGNAVTPPVMELLVKRCLTSLSERG